MVKYSVSKSRLSQNFKNLNGDDTVIRIDKQGRCVSVILERKFVSRIYPIAVRLLGAVFVVLLADAFIVQDYRLSKYITAIFGVLLYQFLNVYEESLIMVHSLGYQVTTKYVGGQKDLFIPWNQVQSIFINEVIIRHKVIHLLTILTKEQGGEKLIPLFVETQPRLKHLELICKHLKGANS